MIFIIPIIFGAAALITSGVGVLAGVEGVSKMDQAKKIGEDAQRRCEIRQRSVERTFQTTQDLAEEYGEVQIEIKLQTIQRFVTFIERIGQKASQKDMSFLKGLEGISPKQIQQYKAGTLEAKSFAKGGLKAVGAACTAGQSTVALVGLFGTASTGTAIGGLSGAAAWNATLAWLGGGSLAAGGGGMALGTVVLGGIAVAPALMIGGFVFAGQGEKALTEAIEYESRANIEIARLDDMEFFFRQIQRRIREVYDVIEILNTKAVDGLVKLESKPFVCSHDAAEFQQVALLIKALSEIMKTPVLDAEGNLNPNSMGLKAKYLNK
ncbi:MAG: hypothetical protein AAFQ14_10370 [Cyanobacteria bacterium J06621_12]